MADNFTFELVSPEKLLLSGEAEIVTIPGTEGDMGVQVNHMPVMTSLRPGLVEAKMTDGSEASFFVAGGFADVSPSGVTVLAEFSVPRAELTREIMDEQIRLAQEAHDSHEDGDDKKANARAYLDQLNHLTPTILPA